MVTQSFWKYTVNSPFSAHEHPYRVLASELRRLSLKPKNDGHIHMTFYAFKHIGFHLVVVSLVDTHECDRPDVSATIMFSWFFWSFLNLNSHLSKASLWRLPQPSAREVAPYSPSLGRCHLYLDAFCLCLKASIPNSLFSCPVIHTLIQISGFFYSSTELRKFK